MNKIVAGIAGLLVSAMPMVANAEKVTVAHAFVENGIQGRVGKHFADLITKATDGKMEFQFFWSGSLGGGAEILHLIRDGAVGAGVSAPVYYGSELPIASLTNGMPFLFDDTDVVLKFQDRMSRTNSHFLAEYERMGVFPILQHGLSASHLMCTKPVTKYEDLAGLKVRTFGAYLPATLGALDMVPVTMALTEVYEGLQRGVVDCVAASYQTVVAFKIHEVAKNWSDINLGAGSGPAFYASWKNYKGGGWTSEVVATVDNAAKQAMAHEFSLRVGGEKAALKTALDSGVTLVNFPDQSRVNKTVPDVLALWSKRQIEGGLDAAIAKDIVDLVRAAKSGN